jgi:tetratricopeptide (TPR) repeat protein
LRAPDKTETDAGGATNDPSTTAIPHDVTSPTTLPVGARIGRFVVLRTIGTGGTGVVYAAHDPDLDRTVALKMLRPEIGRSTIARQRFQREAQALGRLSHPHVITVYDVATVDGHELLAMEFVDGWTLDGWVAAAQRNWRDLVRVAMMAGRGLAAAHAAGLIHRDFKPANVLVGRDGRVVVSDFGLVRAADDESSDAGREPCHHHDGEEHASSLHTRTGAALGTPAYMAPEQQAGFKADARSDQFGFCVTLYEAVYSELPNADRVPTRSNAAPRWLHRVLLRGLAEHADARYPGMDPLLVALSRGMGRRKRALWIASLGLAAALAGVIALQRGPTTSERCDEADPEVAALWKPRVREHAHTAFVATGASFAADAWQRVDVSLDAYTTRWQAMHRDACRATRVLGKQSEALLDRRMACLDLARRELGHLSEMLQHADRDLVEHAVQATAGLADLERCSDLTALMNEVAPPPPTTRMVVAGLRDQVAKLAVFYNACRFREGVTASAGLVERAAGLGYLPLQAEIAHHVGLLFEGLRDWPQAHARFQDAIWAAEASGDNSVALAALTHDISALVGLGKLDEAQAMARRSEAALLRTGSPERAHGALENSLGGLSFAKADLPQAEAHLRQALAHWERSVGPNHPDTLLAVTNLGAVVMQEGHYQIAVDLLRRALLSGEKQFGPDHPRIAMILSKLAVVLFETEHEDEALAMAQRVVAIDERAFGAESVQVATALNNLAVMFQNLHRQSEATATLRRAVALLERKRDVNPALLGGLYGTLGLSLYLEQRYDDALAYEQRALAVLEPILPAQGESYGHTALDACRIYLAKHQLEQARRECERGFPVFERALGANNARLADEMVTPIAELELARGRFPEAIAALERALALSADGSTPMTTARIKFRLARALRAARRDPNRATELARAARDVLAGSGGLYGEERAELDAFLASTPHAP